jgi:hypothetical protein
MVKQITLTLGAMTIVFSLTLIGGGAVSVFYVAQGATDQPGRVEAIYSILSGSVNLCIVKQKL